ncbi:hypothetical protein SDRG_05947 [Saprolegnia diclina VS20]|uniref:Uncharacterized protein n=1 Tax=Saprolegnia diclina (strain VS20) TaxID=1156394 RepID=T0QRG0_SAPDV|nr:hypothetical protein SDRG_05947 [Saprolegnia diclina VS20]EQC36495.1 hypothetical protein SDRG_05947 [Saprolegnia diclina VS20]|eukprot:XP_008609916.1 hypothetical protein SDRG_05947 [Saprolegnia diclina VS20]
MQGGSDSEDEGWRDCVEYGLSTIRIGRDLRFRIRQMEELSLAASFSMLSEMKATSSEISGQRIWPGSYLLAEYLHAHADIVAAKRVLELGAGTGLASLVSRLAGASDLVATDGDLEVVNDVLAWNVQSNAPDATNLHTASLWWGDAASNAAFAERFGDHRFDVLIAGDVLYKGELVPLLLSTVRTWLAPHGRFVLCHIPRADVSHDVLQAALTSHGFRFTTTTTLDRANLPDDCALDDAKRAILYDIVYA